MPKKNTGTWTLYTLIFVHISKYPIIVYKLYYIPIPKYPKHLFKNNSIYVVAYAAGLIKVLIYAKTELSYYSSTIKLLLPREF